MSHEIVEPSQAILSLLCDKAYMAIEPWHATKARSYSKKVYGIDPESDPSARVQLFGSAMLYIYDAMIEWMGPRGESFFLDMYLMANGSLPPLDAFVTQWSTGYSGGVYEPLDGKMVPSVEVRRRSDRSARETVMSDTDFSTSFDVLSPRTEMNYGGVAFGLLTFSVRPLSEYRKELMGELAEPWPSKSSQQPYRYMRPRRHVLPMERPYDESGYMP